MRAWSQKKGIPWCSKNSLFALMFIRPFVSLVSTRNWWHTVWYHGFYPTIIGMYMYMYMYIKYILYIHNIYIYMDTHIYLSIHMDINAYHIYRSLHTYVYIYIYKYIYIYTSACTFKSISPTENRSAQTKSRLILAGGSELIHAAWALAQKSESRWQSILVLKWGGGP